MILEMSKKVPDRFGASVVFFFYYCRKDEKGIDKSIKKNSIDGLEHSNDNMLYIRPFVILSVDLVEDGALTPGVFKK